MSLQGIFDPMVRSYFKNQYGGEGGGSGGGTLNTGRCVSTKNMFVLEITDNWTGLESFVNEYDESVYKVSDDVSFFTANPSEMLKLMGSLNEAQVYMSNLDYDDAWAAMGRIKLTIEETDENGNNILSGNTTGLPDYGANLDISQTENTVFEAQIFWIDGDSSALYAFCTPEAAAAKGFPGTGVYILPIYGRLDGGFKRLVMEKTWSAEDF